MGICRNDIEKHVTRLRWDAPDSLGLEAVVSALRFLADCVDASAVEVKPPPCSPDCTSCNPPKPRPTAAQIMEWERLRLLADDAVTSAKLNLNLARRSRDYWVKLLDHQQ